VQLFNTRPFANNRRGLIFDKPTLDHQGGSASPLASDSSFGHTGFTGTMCWVDPEQELIYVFLSNRVHPNAENPLLVRLNVRTKIHTAIYQKIAEMEKNKRNLATENK
jgi:CubicO group peptidase (beta-lactamase class C family)